MFKLGNSQFEVAEGASFYAGFSDDKINKRMHCVPENSLSWHIDIGMEYGPLITTLKMSDYDDYDDCDDCDDDYDDDYDDCDDDYDDCDDDSDDDQNDDSDDEYEDDEDYEQVSPSLYHNNGFSLGVRSWKSIEGMSKTWDEEYNEDDEEAGGLYVFGHEAVTKGKIEFLKREGRKFLVRWTGTANVYWDEEYGADVPFEFEGELSFKGIYAGCDRISNREELEEAMAKFIDVSEFECISEENHKIEGGISYSWRYEPKDET